MRPTDDRWRTLTPWRLAVSGDTGATALPTRRHVLGGLVAGGAALSLAGARWRSACGSISCGTALSDDDWVALVRPPFAGRIVVARDLMTL
jgi:hypothetical protein